MAKRVKIFALLNSDRHKPAKGRSDGILPTDPAQDTLIGGKPKQKSAEKTLLGQVIGAIDIWGTDRLQDRKLRFRNLLILTNTLLSLAMMVATLQLEWDGTKLVNTPITDKLKGAISICTIAVVIQITEYYITCVKREARLETAQMEKWQPKDSYREYPNIQKQIPVVNNESTSLIEEKIVETQGSINNDSKLKRIHSKYKEASSSITTIRSVWTALRTSNLFAQFCLEILISIVHPFAFSSAPLSRSLGIFMFLRLYIVLRVIRDFSPIYRKRKLIERIPGYSPSVHPVFNTWLTVKMYFHNQPLTFTFCSILSGQFILSYCVYVFEREVNEETDPTYFDMYRPIDSYWISFYIILNSMLLGWGSDTYAQYNPYTWAGRAICLFAVIVGVFFFALFLDYLHSRMQPSDFEYAALKWVGMTNLVEKERQECARLIQIVYRHHVWKKLAKEQRLSKEVLLEHMNDFAFQYIQQLNVVRRFRRKRKRFIMTYTSNELNTEKQLRLHIDLAVKEIKTSMSSEIAELKSLILQMQQQQPLQPQNVMSHATTQTSHIKSDDWDFPVQKT